MKGIQDTGWSEILIKREVVKVMLQIGRKTWNIVPGMHTNGVELQKQEDERCLRPVMRDEHGSQGVRQEIGQHMLRHRAIRRGETDGRCEFMVLFVE